MKPNSPLVFLLIASLTLSCAGTGPRITRAERERMEVAFNTKFLEASAKWLDRVYRVGYKLVTSYVPGHGSEEAKFEFVGVGVDKLEDYARKVYGIDKSVRGVLVRGIYPGSQAEGLDLKPGDVIQRLNGKKVKNLGTYFKVIRKAETPSLEAEIRRRGEILERELPVEKAYYNAQFFLKPTPDVDATASFSKVVVGIGAIRYCQNDDELAVLIGHELAHATLKHSLKKVGVGVLSGVAYGAVAGIINLYTYGLMIGNMLVQPAYQATEAAVSRRHEREADYFGLRHTFHGGYNIENGAKVFGRLATDTPGYNVLAYTFASHPKWPERALRLEKIIEELRTTFPEEAEEMESPDWEISVPVQAGETVQEALDRLIQVEQPQLSAAA